MQFHYHTSWNEGRKEKGKRKLSRFLQIPLQWLFFSPTSLHFHRNSHTHTLHLTPQTHTFFPSTNLKESFPTILFLPLPLPLSSLSLSLSLFLFPLFPPFNSPFSFLDTCWTLETFLPAFSTPQFNSSNSIYHFSHFTSLHFPSLPFQTCPSFLLSKFLSFSIRSSHLSLGLVPPSCDSLRVSTSGPSYYLLPSYLHALFYLHSHWPVNIILTLAPELAFPFLFFNPYFCVPLRSSTCSLCHLPCSSEPSLHRSLACSSESLA